MTATLDAPLREQLDRLFASEPTAMADPFDMYRCVYDLGPVVEWGPMVLVTRYADVRPLLRDGVRYSNQFRARGSFYEQVRGRLTDKYVEAFDEVTAFEAMYMSRTDGDAHKRLRQIAHRAFTPRRITELGTATERYVEAILDPLAGEEVSDLMGLAYWVPLMIIGDLLGVPAADRERIHRWSGALGRNRGGTEAEPLLEAYHAMVEFRAYIDGVLEQHRQLTGASDLVTALMDAEQGDQLGSDELAAMFVVLLFAGHETTTNLIGNGILALLRSRDQWDALCADPALVPGAVQELLRYLSPTQFLGRVPVMDVEIAGMRVPAGRAVRPLLVCANRDENVFDAPDTLDLRRRNAGDHLALGFGPHYCLGSSLARLEAEVSFRALATRFPEIELAADEDELEWTGNASLRRLRSLPVRLGRDHSPRHSAAV
jgi:cytochrome P450